MLAKAKVTLTQLACLGVVMKLNGGGTCASIGEFLWGQAKKAKGSSSCPFARPAGRVLASLVDLGYVERHHDEHRTMFRPTRAGERVYAKDRALTRWKGRSV